MKRLIKYIDVISLAQSAKNHQNQLPVNMLYTSFEPQIVHVSKI